MTKYLPLQISFKLFICILLFSTIYACNQNSVSTNHEKNNLTPEKITVGLSKQPSSSLFFIAQEKGFFKAQNLDLSIINFPSGKRALVDGLLQNAVDLIATTEVPFVFSSFQYQDLKIISTIFVADNVNRIIARRDAGIEKPVDLTSKKVATQKASAVHYFLDLFLKENGMSSKDINLSFMKAEKLPGALAEGKIDAYSMREPFIAQAKTMLGNNAIIFSEPGIYNQVELLVTRDKYLHENKASIRRLIMALRDAQIYANEHLKEANEIISRNLGVPVEVVISTRGNIQQRVSLDQSTLLLLENIARWAISENMVSQRRIPDYLEYIDFDILLSIDENAVSIIH